MRSIEQEGAWVVTVGSFNPSIFQPHWLGARQLIRTQEAENATIAIIQEQVADFKTDWFRMQVLQNRFLLQTLDASHYGPIRDLAAGIFDLLPHTPVKSLRMGRWFHYKMESTDAWHKVGNTLAPKEFWNPLVDVPGMRALTMQARRKGIENGTLLVKIEPSVIVAEGVYIEVNEEHKPSDPENPNAEWVPPLLAKHWDAIMKYSEDLARDLLERVDKNA
jgi:hypothetical protein